MMQRKSGSSPPQLMCKQSWLFPSLFCLFCSLCFFLNPFFWSPNIHLTLFHFVKCFRTHLIRRKLCQNHSSRPWNLGSVWSFFSTIFYFFIFFTNFSVEEKKCVDRSSTVIARDVNEGRFPNYNKPKTFASFFSHFRFGFFIQQLCPTICHK